MFQKNDEKRFRQSRFDIQFKDDVQLEIDVAGKRKSWKVGFS